MENKEGDEERRGRIIQTVVESRGGVGVQKRDKFEARFKRNGREKGDEE